MQEDDQYECFPDLDPAAAADSSELLANAQDIHDAYRMLTYGNYGLGLNYGSSLNDMWSDDVYCPVDSDAEDETEDVDIRYCRTIDYLNNWRGLYEIAEKRKRAHVPAKRMVSDEELSNAKTILSSLLEHVLNEKRKIKGMSEVSRIARQSYGSIVVYSTNAYDTLTRNESTHTEFIKYIDYLKETSANVMADAEKQAIARKKQKKADQRKTLINTPDTRSWMFAPIGIEYTYHAKRKDPNGSSLTGSLNDVRDILSTARDWAELRPDSGRPVNNRVPRTSAESRRMSSQGRTPIAPRDNHQSTQRIVEKMRLRISEMQSLTGDNNVARAYVDNGCIEICSPVHRNWRSMQLWYRWMVKELGSSVTVTNRKRGSGGGHINCAIPTKLGDRFMYNLMVDVANRPYLNWIFNDPSDDHTANCMWDSKGMQEMHRKVTSAGITRWKSKSTVVRQAAFDAMLHDCIMDMDKRGFAIRVKSAAHYEFRCFDAVRNERDLYDVTAFVSAYCRHIYALTLKGIRIESIGGTTADLPAFENVTRRWFNKLVGTIGLAPKNYARFIERNFDVRRKVYGKNSLI